MATLNPQQRKFLSQRLKVKVPQKKGFFSSASKDEKSDEKVTKLFGKLLDEVAKVKAAIAKLRDLLGARPDAQREAEAFAARLAAVDARMNASTEADAVSVFKASRDELAKLLADVGASVKKQEADPKSKARADFALALAEAQKQLALLKVIPNADVTSFASMVDKAQASAAPDTLGGYKQAVKDLAGCNDEFKRLQAVAAKAQKGNVAQSKSKPDCQTELAAAAARLDILQALPGLEDVASRFDAILKAAQALATGNRWTDALKELKKLEALPSLEACRTTSRQAVAGLKGNKAYDDGLALLGKLKDVMPAAELAEHEAAFQKAVKHAVKSKQDLAPVVVQLQSAFDTATQSKAGIAKTIAELKRAKAEFELVSSRVEVALADARMKALEGAQADKDFGTATRLATGLLAELTRDLPARKKARDDWQRLKDQAPLLVTQINALRERAEKEGAENKPVKVESLTLMNKVVPGEIERLTEAAEWALLVANIGAAEQGIARLTRLEADFGAFKRRRDAAGKQVQPLIAAARAAIAALEAAVTQAGKAGGAVEFAAGVAFTARLAKIETLWTATLASAANEADLKLDATVAALAELSAAIAAANNPGAIQAALEGNAQTIAQARFEADWVVLQADIVRLQAVDNQAAAAASAEAAGVRQATGADWQAGLGALAKLHSRVAKDQAALVQGRAAKAGAAAKTVTEVSAKLAALKKSTGKADKFGPFFEALQAECDQLALLAQSPNGDAIAEAEAGLADMLARIELFAPAAAGKPGPSGPTLDVVAGRLAESEKVLKSLSESLTKNCPKTLARLNKELAALKTAMAKQEPLASVKSIDGFNANCESAKAEAAKVIEVRADFDALLPSVQEAVKAFAAGKSAPEYAKALTARVEEAVKLSKKPDELFAALTKLNAVDEELKAAALDPKAALAKEGQIRTKVQTDAQSKAEWERRLELFQNKRLPLVEAAVAGGGTKGLLAELKNMLKAAKDSAGKGDHAQALEQLKLADTRAGEIMADPQGAGIGARNNLPADARLYKDAVTALRELLGAFPQQVSAALPALPAAVTQRLAERVQSLASRFDPSSFDTPVLMLASADIGDKERRARRESALAQVRSTRAIVSGHPLVASLARSPIASAELSAALRRVDNSLVRLDANISRSCA